MSIEPATTPTPEWVPTTPLAAPHPWFGGKSQVAAEVWARFGNPNNYVEPFAGSLAVLLARPNRHQWWTRNESVNDLDGNISNWFRALRKDPEQVAFHASQPVNETDLTARHLWLVQNADRLRADLMNDPDFCDPRAAGWWVWGISTWVGGEWCTGIGPHKGEGVTVGPGVYRKIPMMSGSHGGKGIHKPLSVTYTHGAEAPDVDGTYLEHLSSTFTDLSNRLRRVRVACGDWSRVLGNTAVPNSGHQTAVFLDPPYDLTGRRGDLYAIGDGKPRRLKPANGDTDALDLGLDTGSGANVHEAARAWALQHGENPAYRVAYCSYSTLEEDTMFTEAGWSPYRWSAQGGYALAGKSEGRESVTNKDREVVWFSPTCIESEEVQPALFSTPT